MEVARAAGDGRPGRSTTFYGLLDSVRFSDSTGADEEHRRLRATGRLMLDMLLTDAVPVLTQTQAFDNRLLLDTIARGDADSDALLRLVHRGRLRARLLASGPAEGPPTLLSRFVAALEDESFLFSAWPELADRDVRAAAAAVLRGRSRASLGDGVESRLEALRLVDEALRRSTDDETATVPVGTQLSTLVRHELDRPDQAPHVARVWRDVRRGPLLDQLSARLDTRTGWYDLLDRYADDVGVARDHGTVRSIRSLVDLQYNRRVAASLGAESLVDEQDVRAPSLEALALPRGVAAEEVGSQRHDEDASSAALWLSWSVVAELQRELHELPVQRRAQRLLTQRALVLDEQSGRLLLFLRSVPSRLVVHGPPQLLGSVAFGSAGLLLGESLLGLVAGLVVPPVATALATPPPADRRRSARSITAPAARTGARRG